MYAREFFALFLGILVVPVIFLGTQFAFANSDVQNLQKEIQDKNNRLVEIQREISAYESELSVVGAEKNTLQRAVNQLDLERKKVTADIQYTENKILTTDLTINKLAIEIDTTQEKINKTKEAIGSILNALNQSDNDSFVEVLLRQENLSAFWEELSSLERVKNNMVSNAEELAVQQKKLQAKKLENAQQRTDLTKLKNNYVGQNNVLVNNTETKAQLLAKTKNKESNYQSLLSEREAARETFERQLSELESKLQFILDPNSIPTAGTKVFAWPLRSPRITQYFGDTEFARSGAYNGKGHNGMDMGAPRGTPVSVVLSGTVIATNVQTAYMCQYGKWVLVRHANGITTLYAHMSAIAVSKGDILTTGDTVGYVGDTGYSTGPHLHLTAYASDAVTFKQYTCNSGTTLTIPVSAYSAYLNPLDYLPSL